MNVIINAAIQDILFPYVLIKFFADLLTLLILKQIGKSFERFFYRFIVTY